MNFSEKNSSKEELNEVAIRLATRDKDHIWYDPKHLLVINNELKIEEIFEKEEDLEEITERTVRIVFDEKISNSLFEQENYTIDLCTELPLGELEEKIIQCADESEIENLNDN